MGRLQPRERGRGYTLTELMVTVAVLGILGAIAVPSFQFVLRRERVNALAFEVAGWLEESRSIAARAVNSDDDAGGCAIVIAARQADAQAGDVIASLSDCDARNTQLRVPDAWGGRFQIAHSFNAGTSSFELYFTPRGMWDSNSVANLRDDLEIRIAPADGSGPRRCVRLSSILGSIDIGSSNDGGVSAGCTNYARI